MKSTRLHRILLAFFALIVVGMYMLLFKQPQPPRQSVSQTPTSSDSYTYTSDVLNISFVAPKELMIKEVGNTIILEEEAGSISLSRIGTNYATVQEYINDLEEKNKLNITNRSIVESKYDVVKSIIQYPISNKGDKLSYFIYPAPWTVYTISTSSPELYDKLEQIVQSFQYKEE